MPPAAVFAPHHLCPAQAIEVFPDYQLADVPPPCLHLHDVLEVGLCRSGQGNFFIGSNKFAFEPGRIIIVPPMVAHHAQAAPGLRSHWSFVLLHRSLWPLAWQADSGHVPLDGGVLDLSHKQERFAALMNAIVIGWKMTGGQEDEALRLSVRLLSVSSAMSCGRLP